MKQRTFFTTKEAEDLCPKATMQECGHAKLGFCTLADIHQDCAAFKNSIRARIRINQQSQ